MQTDTIMRLGQYMTPDWAAEALVEHYFPSLGAHDLVIEPSCGRGAFLRALPHYVPAIGVEIDPDLAHVAERSTGRRVIVGDFRMVDLPFTATVMIGNPPFSVRTIEEFLDRAWHVLHDEGRIGLLLPCFAFATAATVDRLAERWSIQQDMLPRNLFPGLSHPLCFAQLTKGRTRGLVGFALYHEAAAIQRLRARYRALLASGEGSVWAAVVRAALEALGGTASLQALYREIDGNQPTSNAYWQAKVRQTVQRIAVPEGRGVWRLRDAELHEAA